MTCRTRRESFFWLRARQFFLSCLFSFSSFLSSPPTLSSSVPWFVSSLQSSAACLANRQSPIDNPGYPVFSLPTFSLSNRTKKVRAPVQSPPKSQVFGPPLGIFSPFASPRLASFLPIASGWSVTCLPHFSPTELPRLKTKPQRSPLTRPFFFFQTLSAFILCTSHVSPNRYRQPAPNWFIFLFLCRAPMHCTSSGNTICECTRRRFLSVSLDPGHLGRFLSRRCFRC